MEKQIISSEMYDQLITSHEETVKTMEQRRAELKLEVKLLGQQIRSTRHYLNQTKEMYEKGE